MRNQAVLYNLQIIGETVKKIPDNIRDQYSAVEWRKIAGLRDTIAHHYFGVDLGIIWDIVINKLPGLRAQIESTLKDQD